MVSGYFETGCLYVCKLPKLLIQLKECVCILRVDWQQKPVLPKQDE